MIAAEAVAVVVVVWRRRRKTNFVYARLAAVSRGPVSLAILLRLLLLPSLFPSGLPRMCHSY